MAINYRGQTFSGYNKAKKTPGHKTKSHAVLAKSGDKISLIRFGQQGVSGDKKKTARSDSFKARHAKNIDKGKMSAAYWANKVKWQDNNMAKKGLYENIHAKRKRIKAGSGESMRKPGSKGAPTSANFKRSAKTAKKKTLI